MPSMQMFDSDPLYRYNQIYAYNSSQDNIQCDLPAMIGGRLDPFDSFAPNLNPMSDSLILYYHQVFSMNSPILNFPRDCFLYSTPDLVWFHSILYIVSADYDVKLGVSDSSLSLYHGGASFKFINTELQEEVIRDSTISAVALVASREGICGNFEISKVHMEGLERIVKRRGGIQNIKGIHAQIATWCDFCYSNIWNLQPRFSRLYDVPPENSVREPDLTTAKSPVLGSIGGISPEMACILRSLHGVSSSSANATDCPSDLQIISMQIYNIEYDLLMLNETPYSQKVNRLSNEAAALKVAAHLYLYLLLRKLPSGSPVFSELTTRFRNALDKCDEVSEDSQYDRLIWRLWILFVGYAAAAEREDKWKFVKGSWAICKALHITRGAQLNSSLRATVWLEPACERWAKSLWADCLRARRGA
ncbi:hypothetical protein J3E68DRAFT_411777 [Trichoderma sp. SZMC 28012]